MPDTTVFDPTDMGILRPNEPPIHEPGEGFQAMDIDDCLTYLYFPEYITSLNPYSLFKLYYPVGTIDSIVEVTNSYDRSIREGEEARGRD